MKETMPIIEFRSLTKRYGTFTAVDKLNLTIREGEIFGLLGPNGAGKSTTILMMLGLTEPSSGSAWVCGIDATRNSIQVKRNVGYLPDDVGFYQDMTGMENLIYIAQLSGLPRREAEIRSDELLERVGLKHAMHQKVGTYSRGMRQRLGLSDVLIKRPRVIVLDEPTLGLDPEGVRELLELIGTLSRDEGITVLLSSHQLHQVQSICTRVGLFVRGRLIADGTVEDLSTQLFGGEPLMIEAELAAVPEADLIDRLREITGILSVESEENVLHVSSQFDASSDVARTVVQSGADLKSLRHKHYGLDEIYHRYFEKGGVGRT